MPRARGICMFVWALRVSSSSLEKYRVLKACFLDVDVKVKLLAYLEYIAV